jgi:hypothetical protein
MSSRNYEQRARMNSRFTNIVNDANNQSRIHLVNNANTIDRIARIITPQVTKNRFENNFFNGTNFHDSDNLKSLILPTEVLGSSLFS